MWWRRRIDDRFERIERALEKLLDERVPPPSPAEPASDIIKGFSSALSSMADMVGRSQEQTSKLTGELLDRAAKSALRQNAREMSDKSRDVRAGRKKMVEGLPPWVAACEECLALLQKRAPKNSDDVIRHGVEHHREQLAVFINQQDLPFNGSGN